MQGGTAVTQEPKANSQFANKRVDFKTKLLTVFVVATNVLGNFAMSWGMKHQSVDLGLSPFAYIRLIFTPWVLLGTVVVNSVAAVAHDAARLGGFELRAAGHLHRLCVQRRFGQGIFRRAGNLATLARHRLHRRRNHFRRTHGREYHFKQHQAGACAMKWLMVAIIVGSTVLADLLQSFEMKRHVVAAEDLRPGRWAPCSANLAQAQSAGAGCFLHGDLVLRLYEAACRWRI